MHIMYVDESGDPGNAGHGSEHFILSGLIISQGHWDEYLGKMKTFRKAMKASYSLNQRVEIHASELIRINKMEAYKKISKSKRIQILKDFCSHIPLIFDSAVCINVCIKKSEYVGRDIFELAWSRLLQRFDTYLKRTALDKGIVVADDTDSRKLMTIQRRMRVYNIVPSHYSGTYNAPITSIIEDTFPRASHHSYFLQAVDVIAHLLYRREYPKGSLRKFDIHNQFDKLEPILLKQASSHDPMGIVRA